ncbi:MAG: hypothetical protein JWL95_3228 [Gemmatimonadetes bacterium]|nr:hypothetical protein [Gemmatimonadota bacterium]
MGIYSANEGFTLGDVIALGRTNLTGAARYQLAASPQLAKAAAAQLAHVTIAPLNGPPVQLSVKAPNPGTGGGVPLPALIAAGVVGAAALGFIGYKIATKKKKS